MVLAQNLNEIGHRRTQDGIGFELFRVVFGLTCRHEDFLGYYDLWPFCKPYDAEEWWLFLEQGEAYEASCALTEYISHVPRRIAPPRISFIQDATGFHLRCNGGVCGPHLFRGEDDKNVWPFNRLPDWANHKTRADALKACLRLQAYLDGRGAKKAKTTKKKNAQHG